jgi:hypothetical protein
MHGIPREVIEHHLKIHPDAKPVSQKPRRQSVERQDFIQKEVRKLLDAGFIEEVHHPVWLANPVIVPKANGKLWMCIDYTSLNKACPKDSYPLPRIDQIVDSTSGCDLLSFLDAYSGFHQIQMYREDRKHTTFVTVDGLYCYVVMPYGLKNALPTFVRAMSKTFGDLIRDRVEVYVDDIVVKTKRGSTLVEDLTLVFGKLRATRTKLNPDKCVFGVSAGKLLGFLVSHRGIEANPEKIKAIEVMRPPARIKDVQKLTGSLATLSRFISRLAERALPFFKLLRKSGPFSWTEEAEQAFQELKQHLVSLPILVALEPGEPLYLYIATATEAVSMVMVVERMTQKARNLRARDRLQGLGPFRGRSTTSVRSSMKQKPGTLRRYTVVEGDLYHRGANGILMRCITQEEGRELLAGIHGGECESHSSSRTLVGKAFRHGFYWPIALQDAAEMVKSCKACQFHAKQIHTLAQALQMIPPSWPFVVWGWIFWDHSPGPSVGIDSSSSPLTSSQSG